MNRYTVTVNVEVEADDEDTAETRVWVAVREAQSEDFVDPYYDAKVKSFEIIGTEKL